MKNQSFYSELAASVIALGNCINSANTEWETRWRERIAKLCDLLPNGSGFDSGTTFDLDAAIACQCSKLLFNTSFHHMNDGGFYDGWTQHRITVRPTFTGFDVSISGSNRHGIKEYIADIFHSIRDAELPA